MRAVRLLCLAILAGCGSTSDGDDGAGEDGGEDSAAVDAAADADVDAADVDAAADAPDVDGPAIDAAAIDAPAIDAAVIDAPAIDAAIDAPMIDAPTGPISGGPCISGAAGATAYRVRWAGTVNGPAYVVYEVDGLPNNQNDRTGAYGYQIGFTPSFVDTFLGEGGLQLDGSDFVDIEISTAGVPSISSISLSIYGRSYAVSSSGSFNWLTFEGSGATPSNLVSNTAPYRWYTADITGDITAGNPGVRMRIKAGPSSGSLVVNRIELCVVAP